MCEQQNKEQASPMEENQILMEYYIKIFQHLNPHVPADYTQEKYLKLIRKQTKRTIDMFKLFDRPLFTELAAIQKACMHYMIADEIPRQERQEILNAWTAWFNVISTLSRRKNFVTQTLQCANRQLNDINKLRLDTAEKTID